ncbi:MAG TPA: hypothetical protein VMG41_02460 [Gemmatimonadales bacterium]|nr:hypothetical protein [Gemmatimonadales bacterium]
MVAVSFAGFSGIVAVVGREGHGPWSPAEHLQFRTLVEPSLIALFGSFLPGTLQLAFQSEAVVWRLSNGALALLAMAGSAAFIARSRTASTTTGQRILLILSFLVIGALVLAALSVLQQYDLIFVLSLVVALVVAAYNFLLLLFPVGRAT